MQVHIYSAFQDAVIFRAVVRAGAIAPVNLQNDLIASFMYEEKNV